MNNAQVMAQGRATKVQDDDGEWDLWKCDSTQHEHCCGPEDGAWTCECCGGRFCYAEGQDDEYADLCDECWANETIAREKEARL